MAYSQKRQRLDRLAEDYLLDSDASVRAVVGLDIEYGRKDLRKATLSVWRARVFRTVTGDELRVVREVADVVGYVFDSLLLIFWRCHKAFRDGTADVTETYVGTLTSQQQGVYHRLI